MNELVFVDLVLQLLLFKLLVEFRNRKKCHLSEEAASTTQIYFATNAEALFYLINGRI